MIPSVIFILILIGIVAVLQAKLNHKKTLLRMSQDDIAHFANRNAERITEINKLKAEIRNMKVTITKLKAEV